MCVYFCALTAIGGELQPQLFILELLQENNDWLLVDAGLPFARHQQDTHHMLLYPSNQFCCPNGSRGCQGRPALFPFLLLNGPIYPQKCAIYQMQLSEMKIDWSIMVYSPFHWLTRKSGPDSIKHCEAECIPFIAVSSICCIFPLLFSLGVK